MTAPSWTAGVWSDVEAGDWVLGNDGYVYLVTAMATVSDDTHVWIARPGRTFDFERRPAQAVRYHRPQGDPQAVEDAVNVLKGAGLEVVEIDPLHPAL